MNWIKNTCFSMGKADHLSSKLYTFLWFLGLSGAIFSYVELRHDTLLGRRLGDLIATLLATATIAQQWTIYRDVHFIEDSPDDASRDYPVWVNMRLERWIRFSILFFLLFGVGKIADSFYPLAERIQCRSVRESVTGFLRPSDTSSHFSHSLFVTGSLAVFFLLTVWNGFALGFRIKNWPKTSTIPERVHKWVVTVRIAMFAILSLICSLYWLFVFIDSPVVQDVAEMIVLIYFGFVILVMALRLMKTRRWLEGKVVLMIDNYQARGQ